MTATVHDIADARPIWECGTCRCFACGYEHVSVHVSLRLDPRAVRWLQCPQCWRTAAACVEVYEAA